MVFNHESDSIIILVFLCYRPSVRLRASFAYRFDSKFLKKFTSIPTIPDCKHEVESRRDDDQSCRHGAKKGYQLSNWP